jgi:AraC-like DNA-binding protein
VALLAAANYLCFDATPGSIARGVLKITRMARRNPPRISQMPSAMGLCSRLALARLRSRPAVAKALLRKARLKLEQLDDPQSRVPVRHQIQFLNLAAEALGDDMLGFNMALDFDMREAGLFYYVLASSDRLVDVFARGARYSTVVNEGFVQKLIDDRRVGLAIRYADVPRQLDRHQMEFWVTVVVRLCRRLTGVHLKPERVRLKHSRARGHARLTSYLGCPVEFGATADEVLFAKEAGQLRVVDADPYLNRLLIEVVEERLARRAHASESFVARVENAVAPLLPHGGALASKISRQLGMSQRTFARRLEDEGLTFSDLVLRLRQDLARRYLVQERLSVSKVAWLLGYKEVATFSHAFRRWTGKAPSAFASRGR